MSAIVQYVVAGDEQDGGPTPPETPPGAAEFTALLENLGNDPRAAGWGFARLAEGRPMWWVLKQYETTVAQLEQMHSEYQAGDRAAAVGALRVCLTVWDFPAPEWLRQAWLEGIAHWSAGISNLDAALGIKRGSRQKIENESQWSGYIYLRVCQLTAKPRRPRRDPPAMSPNRAFETVANEIECLHTDNGREAPKGLAKSRVREIYLAMETAVESVSEKPAEI